MSTIRSTFPSQLITSNFPSIVTVISFFISRIALSDGDGCFSIMLVRKAKAVEDEARRDV